MRSLPRFGLGRAWASAVALVGCASAPGPAGPPAAGAGRGPALEVPRGEPPVLDGKLDDRAWAQASVVELGSGITLRFVHDGATLFLGVARTDAAPAFGFVCALIGEGSDTRDGSARSAGGAVTVLHASAQLGSARYLRGPDGTYAPRSKTYQWRDAAAMMREEGWAGTTVAAGVTTQELAIGLAALGGAATPRPIAVGYFLVAQPPAQGAGPRVVVWPSETGDDAGAPQLLAGENPDGLRFQPARWATLSLRGL